MIALNSDRPLNDHAFAQFLQEEKLMGSRCTDCGALFVPPRALCVNCHRTSLEWAPMSGRGTLAAFTCIAIGPPAMVAQGFDRDHPYCSGVVELEEGPRAVARIEGVDAKRPETIVIGMPMEVMFLHAGDGTPTVLAFKTATSGR